MKFESDNQAGAHPAVLEAIAELSLGEVSSYGEDTLTAKAEDLIRDCFECDCMVFLVTTGTAANALSLSALCPPWGSIYCHENAHILVDENTAVELFTGGARLIGIQGEGGKPSLERMSEHIEEATAHGVHNAKPSAISLTNVTELGTIYSPTELQAYRELADRHNLRFHMDGARFANAVVATASSPADLSWRSGVDVLSFGLTKNGGIAAEAVIFFNKELGDQFGYRRKRSGHLWSKHRFLAAQWLALLGDNLWRENAKHANSMARKLAEGLMKIPNVQLPFETQANEVFPVLPHEVRKAFSEAGVGFYDWPNLPQMVRFVTHFQTDPSDVEQVLNLIPS